MENNLVRNIAVLFISTNIYKWNERKHCHIDLFTLFRISQRGFEEQITICIILIYILTRIVAFRLIVVSSLRINNSLPVIYNSSSNSPVFPDYESSDSWLFRGKGSVETLLVKMTPQRNNFSRIMSKCGLCDHITALMNGSVIKTIKSQHISNLYWTFLLIL